MKCSNKEMSLVFDQLKFGVDNAITKGEIVRRTGLSERTVRQILSDLATYSFIPIGHSAHPVNGGYYIIENEAELKKVVADLESRMEKLEERRDNLLSIFEAV